MSRYLVATDSGGTFVDAVIWDLVTGEAAMGKSSSTPHDPPQGILAAVRAAAKAGSLQSDEVLQNMMLFLNGTTVTTNAIIEHKGARTGLLITAGFEDTLSIANIIGRTAGLNETELQDYRRAEPPPPIVPRALIRGVVERVDARGDVVVPLDMDSVRKALDELVTLGIEALAVCLLWSFRNPLHEQLIRDLVARRYPQLFTVASSDLVPVIREYERANSTAINAFLGPTFHRYAEGLQACLKHEGYGREPLLMQSVGGLSSTRQIEKAPISTLFSGPVGGVVGGVKLGEMLGESNIITTDMGGTTFDVGLILNGSPLVAPTTVIQRRIVCIPTVEIISIGAGGGSVAKLNQAGVLQVGPDSMGSDPGPACYGRGGTTPTVTDADVVLGFIDPRFFLGGRMPIDKAAAEAALYERIAEPLGMTVTQAAAAIYQIVNAQMADLIRRVTVERGNDPRDFAMLAFGGCGPTHCTGYGPDIGVRKLVVPAHATVFSAYGISRSDVRHSLVRTVWRLLRNERQQVPEGLVAEVNAVLSELIHRAEIQLKDDGMSETGALSFAADIRYQSQINEITVDLSAAVPLEHSDLEALVVKYHKAYEKRYGQGSSSPSAKIELVNVRVNVLAPTAASTLVKPRVDDDGGVNGGLVGTTPVYQLASGTFEPTPIYVWEQLIPQQRISGPALIVSYGTTIPLHQGQTMVLDEHRNALIEFPRI